ncbi:MAG: transporter [Chitinivorax sp.]
MGVNASVDVLPATSASSAPLAASKDEAAVPAASAAKKAAVVAAPVAAVEASAAKNDKASQKSSKSATAPASPAPAAAPVAAPAAATNNVPKSPAAESATAKADKPASVAAPATAAAAPAAKEDSARQALAKKDGDSDSKKLLESVLETTDKNYSLLPKGGVDFNYDFNYTYVGSEAIDAAVTQNANNEAVISQFAVNKSASHSFTNTITMDYGLRNNMTIGASVPLVYKVDQYGTERKRWVTGLGDISANLRWQPFSLSRTFPSLTLNGSLRLPTGLSPYEIDTSSELSTGSGTFGVSLGGNVSKVVDPVVLYSSLTWGYSFEKSGLNQIRGNAGQRLQVVKPGDSWSFGMGMGYALSYDVSLNLSTSLSYSKGTELTFNGDYQALTDPSMSGTFNIGLGWRLDPKFTLNINTGIGLTRESPDFSMGASMPINF